MNESKNADTIKERTALISIITDLILAGPAIVVALLANSMILYTDLLCSFNVFLANVLLWAILRKIRKGMGANFDYGAGKIEDLIGVVGGWFVVISVSYIMYTSIHRLISPVSLNKAPLLAGSIIMGLSAISFSCLWIRNFRIHKRMPSPVTDIQWRVPMSNALIAAGILCSLLIMVVFRNYSWSYYVDPVVSLLMGAFVIYSFYGLIKTSLFDLLDRTLEEQHQIIINQALAEFFDEYTLFHGVRSRRSAGKIFIEIFLEFDPGRRVGEVQDAVETMRSTLEEKIENSFVSISLAKKSIR